MTRAPLVTVLIPARNEEADIVACLDAIAAQDHPLDRLEVIVIDGCSSDGTADLARRALDRWGFASAAVLSNEGATASSNLNVGLHLARGEIVCRVDARTRIEPHYVRTCVDVLTTRPEVSVVGGAQVAIARDASARAIGIARALNNRWSMGGSPYRRATASGPSDTVYLGAFRRADLQAVDGWDERLVSNQDFDLNQRMSQAGVVWFEASLRSGYLPRATFRSLGRQFRRFGAAKVDYWRVTHNRPQQRQRLLLAAPPLALVLAVLAIILAGSWWLGVLGVLAVGGLILEARGAPWPPGRPVAHLNGVVAIGIVTTSWWWGAVTRAARRGSPR